MYLWKTITHWMWRGRNRLKWLNRLLKYILFIFFIFLQIQQKNKSTAEFISWIFLIQSFNSTKCCFFFLTCRNIEFVINISILKHCNINQRLEKCLNNNTKKKHITKSYQFQDKTMYKCFHWHFIKWLN